MRKENNVFWYKKDDNWYYEKSRKLKLPKNCPFSTPQLCPRYYGSIKKLEEAKRMVGINSEEIDKKLAQKWEEHPLNPCIAEERPSIDSEGEPGTPSYKIIGVSRFCPEVTFNNFGVFAKSWARITDEVDKKLRHKNLERINADINDWGWDYYEVDHLHYSDCKKYLGLSSMTGTSAQKPTSPEISKPEVKIDYKKKNKFLVFKNGKEIGSFSLSGYNSQILQVLTKAKKPLTYREICERVKIPKYETGEELTVVGTPEKYIRKNKIPSFSTYINRINKILREFDLEIVCKNSSYSIISLN